MKNLKHGNRNCAYEQKVCFGIQINFTGILFSIKKYWMVRRTYFQLALVFLYSLYKNSR